MKTLSAKEYKERYGEKGIWSSDVATTEKKPNYFKRVGQGVKDTFNTFKSDYKTQSKALDNSGSIMKDNANLLRSGLRAAGATARAAFVPIMEAPGIKQATEFVGEKLSETKPMIKFAEWSQKHPEAAKDIMDVAEVAGLFGGGAAAKPAGKVIGKGIGKTVEAVGGTLDDVGKSATKALSGVTKDMPSDIMNRVARLNPTDEVKFKGVAGKTPGEYLKETGNFGSPETVIANESKKFTQSKSMVDAELAKLPGEYKFTPLDTALKKLISKGSKVSTPGAEAEYLTRAQQLLTKSQKQGLSMSEINEVKRLFEREVKLGYNKMMNPEVVDTATRIDSAIRKWQVEQADRLGFTNIRDMNKQTQISKFLVDKLGDKIVGQSALNQMSLTDWVILAGGDPTAVGGFLTKKFFSSKAVQARIAKLLNNGETKGMITPERSLNPAYLRTPALPPGNPTRGQYPVGGETFTPKAPTIFDSGVSKRR